MEKKTPKYFRLTQEELNVIQEVKEKYGYKKEVEALSHIIKEYQEKEKDRERAAIIAEEILKLFSVQYKDYWKRLYFSSRFADKNTTMILDILNTIMVQEGYEECIPIDIYSSSVIEGAKEHMKKKILKRKQCNDNAKRRKMQESR